MTHEDKRRETGQHDVIDIRGGLDSGRSLLAVTRKLSSMRLLVVVGLLTGMYPRSRAKGMVALSEYYG